MSPRANKLLWDIAESCGDILRLTGDVDLTMFESDRDLRHLVERKLAIVGEAIRQFESADPEVAARYTWFSGLVGLRNVIAQQYGELNPDAILRVCQSRIPDVAHDVRVAQEEADE